MGVSQEQITCVLCLFFSFYKIEIQLIDNISGIWQNDTVIHIYIYTYIAHRSVNMLHL